MILDFRFWILDYARRSSPSQRPSCSSNPKSKIKNLKCALPGPDAAGLDFFEMSLQHLADFVVPALRS